MSAFPKCLVKSRENLQAISKNPDVILRYRVFDEILSRLFAGNIMQGSLKLPKYVINLHDSNNYNHYRFVFTEAIVLELIEILKKEYPGVDFTYSETAGYDGKIIEKLIIMDWS